MRSAFLTRFAAMLLLFLLTASLFGQLLPPVLAAPTGAELLDNVTETVAPTSAGSLTTAGGSFTTLVLNATTQTPRWKAYVGNATGTFTLRDALNASIYDWGQASMTGEVYVSRDSSPEWASVECANETSIAAEESFLNHTATSIDSISSTFNESVHRGFWVGTERITNSDCYAIATYVNSTAQTPDENADFQEVLLQDAAASLIFTGLIDQDAQGYDNSLYDFQLIVPEDEFSSTPTTYYFWLELG